MINPYQFVNLILAPALRACNMYSIDAMYLMTCTALVESKLTHIKQLPDGAALGFMQVEWATYLDVCRYLDTRKGLREQILWYCEYTEMPMLPTTLIADMNLNVLVARTKYWMIPEPIPSYKNPDAQARYHEKYYNANPSNDMTLEFITAAKNANAWINIG